MRNPYIEGVLDLCRSMSKVKSYFNKEGHFHVYHKDPIFYSTLQNLLGEFNHHVILLDVGCGDGSFLAGMKECENGTRFIGCDVSLTMIRKARSEIRLRSIDLCVSDAFFLPFKNDLKFDLIHLDSVLHHLIGDTRSKSLDLVKQLLGRLIELLPDDGILITEEIYYSSYIRQTLSAAIIFYGLKLMNFLKIDLSRVIKEFRPGLEVSFLSEQQLKDLLLEHGNNVRVVRKSRSPISKLFSFFLVKEMGHVSYSYRRQSGLR